MTGLVIGKFMPVHTGHLALIRFAQKHCEKLIVSMSYKPDDPIDGELRFSWLRQVVGTEQKISLAKVLDDFDDESLAWEPRTKLWADFITRQFGAIDAIISSEDYGAPLARHLNAQNIQFDPERTENPISASLIRKQPFTYWDFIPEVVQPFFVKKICFVGPESTGKTVMTENIARRYNTEFVPEVAREMLESNDFLPEDLIKIATAQVQRVIDKTKTANKILICDTDIITTQIYCRHYLGSVPKILNDLEEVIRYDQYFVFSPDVPWVYDPLRDLPDRREEMFNVFKSELEKRGLQYLIVSGDWAQREKLIADKIDMLLND